MFHGPTTDYGFPYNATSRDHLDQGQIPQPKEQELVYKTCNILAYYMYQNSVIKSQLKSFEKHVTNSYG